MLLLCSFLSEESTSKTRVCLVYNNISLNKNYSFKLQKSVDVHKNFLRCLVSDNNEYPACEVTYMAPAVTSHAKSVLDIGILLKTTGILPKFAPNSYNTPYLSLLSTLTSGGIILISDIAFVYRLLDLIISTFWI